jgi:murein DD-endopeptidase
VKLGHKIANLPNLPPLRSSMHVTARAQRPNTAASDLRWPIRRMMNRLLVTAGFAGFAALGGLAQTHSGFPVDILVGPAPQPVMADGRAHLLYELRVTNVAPIPIELLGFEVFGGNVDVPLASYRGEALKTLAVPVENVLVSFEPIGGAGKALTIGEGRAVLLFVDLTLGAHVRMPEELRHRFSFDIKGNAALERTVNGPVVGVVQEPPPVLHAPLRGSSWIAFNSLATFDHRRAFQAVDGRLRIAQRFAIDWMLLGHDERLFHDDAKSNANFYGYGAEVLAVTDAQVADLKDGLSDNLGSTERSSRSITLDNALGNYVILDLGHRRFATYAHLQPGSLKVKLGDAVKAGQALARLGNSGNSDEPHLHFQLTDANSPLGAEGIPYELEMFTQLGALDDEASAVLDKGEAWRPTNPPAPVVHRREFPVDKAVVILP